MRDVLMAVCSCLFLCHCANIVPPNGGLKDTSPPILLSIEEEGNSINLSFNENIKLENQADFYCSPPLKAKPKLKTQRNQVFVEGEWRPDISYSLHFPSVIGDYNEGNLIKNLHVHFPINTTDTLSLSGYIKNDFQEKAKDVWAALYIYSVLNRDSALLLSPPHYIAKIDENGLFTFPNLTDTSFWLFALDDKDRNLKYNLPEENVGFYANAVKPYALGVEFSLFNESAAQESLSLQTTDSVTVFGKLTIDSLPEYHIVELIHNNNVVRRSLSKSRLVIDSLRVGAYELRIIQDYNSNGVWDTGSLIERKSPEPILYYPEKIQLRENWELEINWKQ